MNSLRKLACPARSLSSEKGFSLIETVIAMVILAGGILVLTNSWSGSMLAVRKSRQLNTASLLLQKKMTEFEIKYEGKPLAEVKEEDAGDFGDEYKDFTWTMKSKKIEVPDLTAGMTAKDGGANEMELTIVRKLIDFIEKSVLEMKVTVIKKNKDKPYEYSATTYVVDYTQSLASAAGDAAGAGGGGGAGP